ncbi:MmgE/PrpD family protein [Tissierella sp. MSJ-40]|uniref:MmgE/PrpD family protein n=1 Tax=Tissierella simiarum TaxID=2841534 RepID=A0ABS6E191_9FIRM|nr:MmgE/PrpD family protein [Tissierella simiarum]MBU5436657.1 MmgE/PrpD family protein [Tissierella simiarum]
MNNNLTDKFIDSLYSLMQETLPEAVIKQAKICILDYLGVTLAGARMLERKGNKFLNYFDSEQGDATLIGFNRKATIQNAVIVNGLSSHILELDDGQRFGMIHPGAPIISALISLVEHEKIKGKDFLLGTIIGYEAAVRLAGTIQPSHKQCGYHATGTCGTIGVAVGIAVALGFTKKELKDALSAAATSASGILEVIEDESELKPFNVGKAALNGLIAAFVARAGFTGPNDILGGKRGFISTMSKQYDLSFLDRKQGDAYGIERIYIKPYAACRHSHPAIEATINIRSKYSICPDDIKNVKVYTYDLAIMGHDHTQIQGTNSAKMSIPYSVAVALEFGKAGIEEFMPRYIQDTRITSLINKIQIYANKELTTLVPEKRSAIVEIITYDNKCYIERVDYPKGEPENPMTEEEIKEKFISLAMYGKKSMKEAHEIIEMTWNLEKDLFKIFDFL